MKKTWMTLLFLFVVLSILAGVPPSAFAQNDAKKSPVSRGPVQKISTYFSIQETTFNDGVTIERDIISSPPAPPIGYEHERPSVSRPEPNETMGINSLTEVPAFRWVFGCSAVSGAMIAGYYDRIGLSSIYAGPTNNGEMPLMEDLSWGNWTDSNGDTYPNNPLIASHNGMDGRTRKGSIDDYWVSYLVGQPDPYITGGWAQHAWGDAIGDYMKTSQSAYGNDDGSTSFYTLTSASPLTCSAMESYGIDNEDGTYGRKLFYEAKGYAVTDCYSQKTDNVRRGGFSFAQYKAEIDAGRPVFLNLIGHSIVGVGYDDSTATIYIHDTWDNGVHTMPWGGSYSGMKLDSVSIVSLQSIGPDIFVSPASYDFGRITVKNTSSMTFSISNTGTGELSIGQISISGSQVSEFNINNDNCSGHALNSPVSCDFQVTFAPLSDGSKSAVLSIPSNDTSENPANVPLSGTGYTSTQDLSGSWTKVSSSGPNKKGIYMVSGTFTTTNTGSLNASNVVVNYYLLNSQGLDEQLIATSTIRSISAGSSKATTIQYSTSSSPKGKYLIAVVDPSNSIAETDEGNNRQSIVIP
jgi:hypothetical protein